MEKRGKMSRSLRHSKKGPRPGCFSGISKHYTEACSDCEFGADCTILCLNSNSDYDKEKK